MTTELQQALDTQRNYRIVQLDKDQPENRKKLLYWNRYEQRWANFIFEGTRYVLREKAIARKRVLYKTVEDWQRVRIYFCIGDELRILSD